MHPVLVATLAEDRRRRCPCGAVTQSPYRPCRNCRHGHHLDLQNGAAAPSRRPTVSAGQIRRALPFAHVLASLQSVGKGAKG
jgi:hypothetical protein